VVWLLAEASVWRLAEASVWRLAEASVWRLAEASVWRLADTLNSIGVPSKSAARRKAFSSRRASEK